MSLTRQIQELCERASKEQDGTKLLNLVRELTGQLRAFPGQRTTKLKLGMNLGEVLRLDLPQMILRTVRNPY